MENFTAQVERCERPIRSSIVVIDSCSVQISHWSSLLSTKIVGTQVSSTGRNKGYSPPLFRAGQWAPSSIWESGDIRSDLRRYQLHRVSSDPADFFESSSLLCFFTHCFAARCHCGLPGKSDVI